MDENNHLKSYKVPNQLFFDIILEDLKVGKSVKFNVAGNSMLPFLKHGDQVVIKQPINFNVNIGDIILARYKGRIILHRLIRIDSNHYYLAGDGNLDQIETIEKADILATVLSGSRGDKALKINSKMNKKMGVWWYYIRPLRYLFSKFKLN